VSFEADVYPILSSACAPCHGANGFSGVSVADPDVEAALDSAKDSEAGILSRVGDGDRPMPPSCSGAPGSGGSCLTVEQFETLEAWYEAGGPE
jgi:mono/diheme cytochrome c family protein